MTTTPLPIPFTCVGGFTEAYYGRPERLLDPGFRAADPAWAAVDEMTARRSVAALRSALESATGTRGTADCGCSRRTKGPSCSSLHDRGVDTPS